VLPPREREIPRRIVVEELQISDERSPAVSALDQVMAQQGVLWKPSVRGSLEGIDVVDAFAREASLAPQILIDVGHRNGVGIDARMTRMNRSEPRAVRAGE
jgi:hypothetical protein